MKYLKTYKLYESNSNDFYNLIKWDWVKDYHSIEHGDKPPCDTLEEMLLYLDPWNYFDDDKYIEEFIQGECDYYVSDFDDLFEHDSYKDNFVDFIEKLITTEDDEEKIFDLYLSEKNLNKDDPDDEDDIEEAKDEMERENYEWFLMDFSMSVLRDLVREWSDTYDFSKQYLEDRYKDSTAKEILSEFHGKNTLDDSYSFFLSKDGERLTYYVDEEDMKKDIPDYEDSDIKEHLDIKNDKKFQKAIFKEYPELVYEMIEYGIVNKKLVNKGKFQRRFFQKVKEMKDEIELEDVEKLTDLGAIIKPEISEEFDIDYITGGIDIGLF